MSLDTYPIDATLQCLRQDCKCPVCGTKTDDLYPDFEDEEIKAMLCRYCIPVVNAGKRDLCNLYNAIDYLKKR